MYSPPRQVVVQDVTRALLEDLGDGDCTAALIPEKNTLETRVISRETAVLSGCPWFEETFTQLDAGIRISWQATDGDFIEPNQEICRLKGSARSILSGERTALNFLQTLSGTATQAHHYVAAVKGTGTIILDTRKTVPGLRLAQKYAVRCGGASNHRIGLFDAILIKENHISAAGSITVAVTQALHIYPDLLLEVEVENMEQLEEARAAGAQRVLLDNFNLDALKAAVDRFKGQIGLEASGGINMENVADVAATGVDAISLGCLTHSAPSADLSLELC